LACRLRLKVKEDEIKRNYSILVEANIEDHSIREQHVQYLKIESEVHSQNQQAKCCVCNKTVSDKVKSFCLSSKKFNGKIYCFEHQKSLG